MKSLSLVHASTEVKRRSKTIPTGDVTQQISFCPGFSFPAVSMSAYGLWVPSKGLPDNPSIGFWGGVTDPSSSSSLPESIVADGVWPVEAQDPPQAPVDECLYFRHCGWSSSMTLIQMLFSCVNKALAMLILAQYVAVD